MKRVILVIALLLNIYTVPANAASNKPISFQAEIWVDNWFELYINGKLVGHDSVPITTERSFNSEKVKFTATYPFTIGLVVRDFTENASGLEYIGKPNQQIGDGGAIAQIRDLSTNSIIAATDGTWKSFVVSKAPLNPDCVKSSDPLKDCKASTTTVPKSWATNTFKDSTWPNATTYSTEAVGVKEGYFDFTWSPIASLVWSSDLKLDNTVLLRKVITKPTSLHTSTAAFTLSSPAFLNGGTLPIAYTCDGDSNIPPLSWSSVPAATKSLVITFDTLPGPPRPGETDTGKHAMFVLYNIPITSTGYTSISNLKGTFGQNFQGRSLGYTPPCSQGPGDKKYTFTIYALSSLLDIPAQQATEAVIEKAIAGQVLATSSISVTYARKTGGG